jgi:hypothetical protein
LLVKPVPAVAVNVADVAPFAITTDAGTGRLVLLLLNETELEPDDGWLRLTVQVVDPPAGTLVGVQLTEGTVAVTSPRLKKDEAPFSVPVIVAVWLLDTAPVVTTKVTELAFPGIVTLAGTFSAAALSVRVTVAPLERAGFESVMVQVVLELAARLVAAHCREEMVGSVASVMVAVCEDPLRDAVTVAV